VLVISPELRLRTVRPGSSRGGLFVMAGRYTVIALVTLFVILAGQKSAQRGFWLEFGVALGFIGLAMLCLQSVLTARYPKLSGAVGQDTMLQFHRQTGLVAFGFVPAHPEGARCAACRTSRLLGVPRPACQLPASDLPHRRRRCAALADLVPPRLGPGGWDGLWRASVDTLAMSVLATVVAAFGGMLFAIGATRPYRSDASAARRIAAWVDRTVLLLFRAVPAPVWAFLFVLVLFPGIWPGAVALGVYNVGVLGRLFTEVLEDHDDRARRQLDTAGASPGGQLLYAVLPVTARRLASLALYRWEVIARETVIVGVVGAAGLGRLIQEHLIARDFHAVLGAVGALVALTVVIDALSAGLQRAL